MPATHDDPDARQIEAYRRLTPGQRLESAQGLYATARELKAAALRATHPEWTDTRITREVVRIFLHART